MQCLRSSCAILSTMAMLCWCRTPAAGSWREATSTRSCCSTPWVAGPRTMTCPWTGGWNNMQLCSKKRFLIPSQPLLPSSHLPCYMLAPQRWAVPWAGLWDSQMQGQVSEKQEHFWDSLWADSDIFWSLFFIWSDCFHIEFVGLPWWLRVCLQCKRPPCYWVRKILWRREWQPTPVFLPGEFHGQRSLVGYSPWGCKELDTTEPLTLFICQNTSNIKSNLSYTAFETLKVGMWTRWIIQLTCVIGQDASSLIFQQVPLTPKWLTMLSELH